MQRILSLVRTISLSDPTKRITNVFPTFLSTLQHSSSKKILTPYNPIFNPVCGLKVKGRVKRRCKSCYIVVRDERMYVMCPKFPRHKQMSMKPKPHNTWTLTHASQSRTRPW